MALTSAVRNEKQEGHLSQTNLAALSIK